MKACFIVLPCYCLPGVKSLLLSFAQELQQLRDTLFMSLFFLASFHSGMEYEVIIVDDNSPDGTENVAKALRDYLGKDIIQVLKRPRKLGLGTAYIDGLKLATGSHVVIMDADLSHQPKYIPSMASVMKQSGADVVTGTRYVNGGGVAGWDLMRKLTSGVANVLATELLRSGVSDVTGSFRLWKREVLEDVLAKTQSKGVYSTTWITGKWCGVKKRHAFFF